MSSKLKAKDKEKLVRNRGLIVRTVEITGILDWMCRHNAFSSKEAKTVLADNARRQRVNKFLDILETKKQDAYDKFLDIIEETYPHIYLALVDWEDDQGEDGNAVEDEWAPLRVLRKTLIREMDGGKLVPFLQEGSILSSAEVEDIMSCTDTEKRTEAFLDIIEAKTGKANEIFLDAVGEVYPHIYLMLTDHDEDDVDGYDEYRKSTHS